MRCGSWQESMYIKVKVAVVGQRILQSHLVTPVAAVHQIIECSQIIVKGSRLDAETGQQRTSAFAIAVAGVRMPAAGEGVNSEDGIILCAQCLTSIKEDLTELQGPPGPS